MPTDETKHGLGIAYTLLSAPVKVDKEKVEGVAGGLYVQKAW